MEMFLLDGDIILSFNILDFMKELYDAKKHRSE